MNAALVLDTLVEAIAERVAEKLRGSGEYSQDKLPPHMNKRTYLEHCARADWPNKKVGRLRVTRQEDFQTWLGGCPSPRRMKRADEYTDEELLHGQSLTKR